MIDVRPTKLDGCLVLQGSPHSDERGLFVKSYQESVFAGFGLPTVWREQFFSRSIRGVVRGLHFQLPPAAQDKLVSCVKGSALDVIVDVRVGSPTYGEFAKVNLDEATGRSVFIPTGMAHGFAALSDDVVMAYSVTAEHVPALDSGIRWDSIDMRWPVERALVSVRDAGLPTLAELDSPFVFANIDRE